MALPVSIQEVRAFLYQDICQHLGQAEIHALVFTQDLPPTYLGKQASEVLMKLEMLDRYSVSNLASLSQMLKTINRNDLAKKVDKFCKASKKQSSKKSVLDVHKHNDYIIEANLTVTKLQTLILLEQIEELKKSVSDRGLVQVETVVVKAAETIEEDFQKHLERVSKLLATSRKTDSVYSTDSNGSPTSTSSVEEVVPHMMSPHTSLSAAGASARKSNSLPRDIGKTSQSVPKVPLLPPTTSTEPEQDPSDPLYEDVRASIPLPPLPQSHYYSAVDVVAENRSSTEHGQMVTGRDGPQQAKPHPPVIKPKPRVRKNGTLSSNIRNSGSDYSGDSSIDYSGDSSKDYSGGTDYTGGSGDTSTGDSGFVDAKKYLKRPLSAQQPDREKPRATPRTYYPLKPEQRDEPDYYKSRSANLDALLEVMAIPGNDNSGYVNVPSNRSSK